MRSASVERKTNETNVLVSVALDGTGVFDIKTGVGFFDHMLEQLARHSLIDMTVKTAGDLHVDFHHTVEDTGIALGQAISKALGERIGIKRYSTAHLPMDETLTRVALDISGRPYLVWDVEILPETIGNFPCELVKEFFRAFAMNAGITLHMTKLHGSNAHHIAEACFKGLARALREAVEIDPRQADRVPSTKGTLTV